MQYSEMGIDVYHSAKANNCNLDGTHDSVYCDDRVLEKSFALVCFSVKFKVHSGNHELYLCLSVFSIQKLVPLQLHVQPPTLA